MKKNHILNTQSLTQSLTQLVWCPGNRSFHFEKMGSYVSASKCRRSWVTWLVRTSSMYVWMWINRESNLRYWSPLWRSAGRLSTLPLSLSDAHSPPPASHTNNRHGNHSVTISIGYSEDSGIEQNCQVCWTHIRLPFPADCGGVSWPCQRVSYSLPHGAWKENSPTDRWRAWDCFSVSAFINFSAALQLHVTPRFFCPWWN